MAPFLIRLEQYLHCKLNNPYPLAGRYGGLIEFSKIAYIVVTAFLTNCRCFRLSSIRMSCVDHAVFLEHRFLLAPQVSR